MDAISPHSTVIAIGNQRGGTGKSTLTVHLAAALGLAGKRCLILDLDPASGATKHPGVPVDTYAGTLELLTTDEPLETFVVTKGLTTGVALVPSRPQLAELEASLSRFTDRTRLLERVIDEARTGYDFVLLDTGPSAGFATTVAAYSAAEWFLLTAFPHPLSLAGLSEAFRDIADVRRLRNPSLEVLGVLLIKRAGLTPWPRVWHNLRASCQTELSARLPLHVVCSWLGNTTTVATQHYPTVRESDFENALSPQPFTPTSRLHNALHHTAEMPRAA
jgi:chromosome partitioning protein